MSVELVTVAEEDGEARLDRWFKRHYPGLAFGKLAKLCRTGQVRIDGKRCDPSDRIEPGVVIRVPPLGDIDSPPPPREVSDRDAADLKARVLFKDKDVLIINKPAGLAVQGGSGTTHHLDGMLSALQYDSIDKPRLVHRLDRDTSGVLVLARTAAAANALAAAFKSRETEKVYWAICAGIPPLDEGTIDLKLAKKGGPQGERVAVSGEEGLRAITHYRTIDSAPPKACWIRLEPETGRTHQLRVHCQAMGTPILGDVKYGASAAILQGVDHPRQLHLHARSLRLPHPKGGYIDVTAPPPPHMLTTFRYFGFSPGDDR
ncbi:RluA family pseudouridine synthase [Lacibacterium aquatile]|uniref:Pseudouridine synthase n=1 Tax=Lacibacterium aquatile TaxID=1168082 RepID=A0ABW5DSL7_9PROT